MIYKFLLFFSILIGVGGQLFLKIAMKNKKLKFNMKSFFKTIYNMYINLYTILGAIMYGCSLIIWIIALSKVDLSYAYPLVSINFILIALFSRIFLKEKINRHRLISISFIILGIIFISIS